jgi:hypothetical protein
MRDRLLRSVSVGFSLILLSHFSCPVADAEPATTEIAVPYHSASPLQIRQCYQPGTASQLNVPGSTLISASEPSMNKRTATPIFIDTSARDTDLNALFQDIRQHYRTFGHFLTADLTLSDSKTVNAFARNQKTVVITRSLIARTKTSSEVAFVMAHELAHIALRHDQNSGVRGELEADALALKVVMGLGFDPCSGSEVLERLGAPAKLTLVSVSPRLNALHDKTFRFCG